MGRKVINLTGQIFTRLTVIEKVENNKWGDVQWLCRCICGNEVIVRSYNLKSGASKSCGCLQKEIVKKIRILPKGEGAFNNLYYSYKEHARKRNIEWNLTKKQFKILTKGNCIYCGIEPLQVNHPKRHNGDYIYNGIDRVDNNKGYIIDNCVSCCGYCNWAKKDKSQKEFLEWIKKVYNNIS